MVFCGRWAHARAVVVFGLLLGLWEASEAAPPKVDALFPAGGAPGSEVALELVGEKDARGFQLWCARAGFEWVVPEEASSEGRLRIGANTLPGVYWLRFYNEEGLSVPLPFVVDPSPGFLEVEPNDSHRWAKSLGAIQPSVVHGRLQRSGDVDAYAVTLERGQWLRAELEAYRLGAPVDPLFRLTDENGHVLQWQHDGSGTLDPVLHFRAENGGVHMLMVSGFDYPPKAESRFAGSSKSVYRLRLASEAPRHRAWSAREPEWIAEAIPYQGRLGANGEEDRYAFAAKKGTRYKIEVKAQSLGSGLVPRLAIEDEKGKELLASKDPTVADPELIWKAPDAGRFHVVVKDWRGQGGERHYYGLRLTKAVPSYTAKVDGSGWRLEPGSSATLKVTLEREHGHDRPVILALKGLPPEVDAGSLVIPSGETEAELRLGVVADHGDAELETHAIRILASDGLGLVVPVVHTVKGTTTEEGDLLRNDVVEFLLLTGGSESAAK